MPNMKHMLNSFAGLGSGCFAACTMGFITHTDNQVIENLHKLAIGDLLQQLIATVPLESKEKKSIFNRVFFLRSLLLSVFCQGIYLCLKKRVSHGHSRAMKQTSVCTANSIIFTMGCRGWPVFNLLFELPLNSFVVYNPIFRWIGRQTCKRS